MSREKDENIVAVAHLEGADILHEQESWPTCLEFFHRTRRDLVHELTQHYAVLKNLRMGEIIMKGRAFIPSVSSV